MAKKRFTFADAKEKIKNLEDKLEAVNVNLEDNIVTNEELRWLRFYKVTSLLSLAYFTIRILIWFF